MKKLNLKNDAVIFMILTAVIFCSCSKSKAETEAATNTAETVTGAQAQTEQPAQTAGSEKDYLIIEDFEKLTYGLYEKGGVALYEAGEIYDVPENFPTQEVKIFGIPDDYFPPEEPLEKIVIMFNEGGFLQIQLPPSVYESTPELYLEAEHDGKTFVYENKSPLHFEGDRNNQEIVDYRFYTYFENRNLYSKSNDWTIRLKNCQTDELVAEQVLTRAPIPCGYVVYSNEYENPFAPLETRSVETNKKMHLLYKGKGGAIPMVSGGTMVIFSYDYYAGGTIIYIPFLSVKTKTDDGGICTFDFSIREPGQYKLDFYDVETQEVRYTSFFDFISVSSYEKVKHVATAGTEWKVNSPEGLRLRNMPWGEKVGLLEDGTEIIQTEDALFPFYDFIDGQKGFWIPVKRKVKPELSDNNGDAAQKEKPEVYWSKTPEPDGWVFSGFLTQI